MPRAVDTPEFHFQEHADSLDLVLPPFRSRILRYFFPSTEIICLLLVKRRHLLMPFNSLPQFQDDVFILNKSKELFVFDLDEKQMNKVETIQQDIGTQPMIYQNEILNKVQCCGLLI